MCLRYARDTAEADDLAQDTWVTALGRLDQYRADGPLGAWLRRVAVTTCLQALRRRRRALDWSAAAADALARAAEAHAYDPAAVARLGADELLAHIKALPEPARLVFNLVAVEGYSHAEAAAAIGIAESSSRSLLTRARAALRQRLANYQLVCI